MNPLQMAEGGRVPDALIRLGIRKLLRDRLARERKDTYHEQLEALYAFLQLMSEGPVAVATQTANEQHYEVPAELFQTFMGEHLKYSCGLWEQPGTTLSESETTMLEKTCERAELEDGMQILELGCGWGSLSLWMADHYPAAHITAVSNSRTQREYILAKGKPNLDVITADMNSFDTQGHFDRIVSVEMFEHMRNWEELLKRIHRWLNPAGKLFIHIFVHRELAYLFNESGQVNWMAEHFFKEGMMPAEHLLHMLNKDMRVTHHWRVNGTHYGKTLRAWLERIDQNREQAIAILEKHHGADEARVQFGRWRIFFIACEELFNYRKGTEWYIAHYLLEAH